MVKPDHLISDEALRMFQFMCNGIVLQVIGLFGTVTNIINIICFVKQDFGDPINVSLLGLAISDLGSLVTLLYMNVLLFPSLQELDLPFDPVDFQHLTAVWPHIIFSRITSWITAVITVERCLCITMPLKVKNLITSKRMAIIIILVFLIIIGASCPKYYTTRFAMTFSPERNRTILGIVYTDDRPSIEPFTYAIGNVLLPAGAFVTIVIGTVVLDVTLYRKAKWRKTCTGAGSADSISERDQRVAKMVVMISALFIACFVPVCLAFIAAVCVPGFSEDGQYKNTTFVIAGLSFVLESMNSAMNIFIYYYMSSRYKTVFRQLFSLGHKR